MTPGKLAAGLTAVFVTALLSAGLAYALGGLLLAWWLLIDLGSFNTSEPPAIEGDEAVMGGE
jgi:hypothetical protein